MRKFQLRDNSTKLYIPMDNIDYAVVNAGEVGEIPVSFKAETDGTYTLGITKQEVDFSYLHLIDNLTGADIDLLHPNAFIAGEDTQSAAPSYTFQAKTTDYASRFRLVFAIGSSVESDSFGFINSNGNLVIFGVEDEATVQVVDVTGHILLSESFSGSYEKRLNVAPSVYMLHLVNGSNVKVQKIVVR